MIRSVNRIIIQTRSSQHIAIFFLCHVSKYLKKRPIWPEAAEKSPVFRTQYQ